ncbi:MAG TPA: di-heme oxidoredictase family protein, partial [Bryobacteraceae bacterium]|nr:di-heme oxidoredictase family protein [Bryobacteraceae bacterium]
DTARDPGVRAGTGISGEALDGLTAPQLAAFTGGLETFKEVSSVDGSVADEPDGGLGPSFNMTSCGGCHAFPAVGGSSPPLNPQVAAATANGGRNIVPSFITSDGPIREVRFKRHADGRPDGGVHALFVITERFDAPSGCDLRQTDFAEQVRRGNAVFRIPTPLFGAGLIEAIPDSTILTSAAADARRKDQFGIHGRPNRTDHDGSITRFGWKAQNASLLVFAGEAYAVEQGITNDLFPQPRESGTGCVVSEEHEDHMDFVTGEAGDLEAFVHFMRLLAPPAPVTEYGTVSAESIQRGLAAFNNVGCAFCHTERMTTGRSYIDALNDKEIRLFSDLLLHNMGTRLADGISQGVADGDEFRTAPLWGLGQRIFFLHDGRTKDLLEAIRIHASDGSEANQSIRAFEYLSDTLKQDLLNFLRSL